MIDHIRNEFNSRFTQEQYEAYVAELANIFPGHLDFRVAETPVFVPHNFKEKMLETCNYILDVVTAPDYLQKSEAAIPSRLRVPNEDAYPQFIAFDFGVCKNEQGYPEPRLIELQAFPTLFAWHVLMPEAAAHHYWLPQNFTPYLNGLNRESYEELLRKIILGPESPENVVLLELFPHRQKTRVDFYATEQMTGIKAVCLTEVIQEGRTLFYNNKGKKTPIRRIYNRVIFDELLQQAPEVQEKGTLFQQDLDVSWVPHPNWFYRISKFSLPFLHHPCIPETRFLHELPELPSDLENYVVKPLFSFAGQGVLIDVTKEELEQIPDPQNWIIQQKVTYAPAVETPNEPAKAEIRIFYFWEPGAPRPIATNNLARLSKGKMIGVRYNKDKDWVGGTYCLFQPEPKKNQ